MTIDIWDDRYCHLHYRPAATGMRLLHHTSVCHMGARCEGRACFAALPISNVERAYLDLRLSAAQAELDHVHAVAVMREFPLALGCIDMPSLLGPEGYRQ